MRAVLHVTPDMSPSSGGPPVVVERLAGGARAEGWRARIIAASADAATAGETTILPGQTAAFGAAGAATLATAVADADVVHLHTMWSPLCLAAARKCRDLGKPYVLSPHGMLDPYSLSVKALKKKVYWKLVERRVAQGASATLFTTTAERDLAFGAIGPLPNPQVIGLGADAPPKPLDALQTEFLAEFPDMADRRFLLFLGRLHPKKGPDRAIDAFARLAGSWPDLDLLIVGDGDAAYVADLVERARATGLGPRIRFLGMRLGEAKWSVLAAAYAFVLSSHQENFGIAVAEALQAGVPTLLSRPVNISAEIEAAGAGLSHDLETAVDSLATQVAALLADPGRHAAMAVKARELASQRYNWPASVHATHQLYDSLLAPVAQPQLHA